MSAQVLICKFAVFTCVSYFFYRCRTWLAWLAGSQFVKTQKQSYVSVSLLNTSDPWHLVHNGDFKISARKAKKVSNVCFDVQNHLFSIRASKNLYIKRWILFKRELKKILFIPKALPLASVRPRFEKGAQANSEMITHDIFNLIGAAPLNIE